MTMQYPDIIDRPSRQDLVNQLIERLRGPEGYPRWREREAGDAIQVFADAAGTIIYLGRQYANARIASQLLPWATGQGLDDLGVILGIARTAGQSDADYRQVLTTRPALTAAGTEDWYDEHARAVDSRVIAVQSTSPSAGSVTVNILSSEDEGGVPGTPSAGLPTVVQTYLRQTDLQLVGSTVTVTAPTIREYRVACDATVPAGLTLAQVQVALQAYSRTILDIGTAVTRAGYSAAALAAGATNAVVTLQDAGGTAQPGDLAAVAGTAYSVRPARIVVT